MSRFVVLLVSLGLGGLLGLVPGCRRNPPAAGPAAGSAVAKGAAPVDKAAAARALLTTGRGLLKTDLAAAGAAFAEAQKLAPENPDILSELAQVQFFGGNLDLARDTVRAALRAAETPAQTAAPSYNLARIEEAAGHLEEAVTAYELAAAARPSPELRKHLDLLKAVLSQGQPQPLAGPFAALPLLCAELKTAQQAASQQDKTASCSPEQCEFSCPLQDLGRLTAGLPPPMDEVRVFWSRLRNKPAQPDPGPEPEKWGGEPRCGFVNAAVRLGNKWYLAPTLGSFCSGGALQGGVKLTRIAVESVGSAKLVALRLEATQDYGSGGAATESLTLLGVGPSRKPSRLGPILLSAQLTSEPAPASADSLKTRDSITYEWRLADGALLIGGQTVDSLLGEHKVTRKTPLALRYPLALP